MTFDEQQCADTSHQGLDEEIWDDSEFECLGPEPDHLGTQLEKETLRLQYIEEGNKDISGTEASLGRTEGHKEPYDDHNASGFIDMKVEEKLLAGNDACMIDPAVSEIRLAQRSYGAMAFRIVSWLFPIFFVIMWYKSRMITHSDVILHDFGPAGSSQDALLFFEPHDHKGSGMMYHELRLGAQLKWKSGELVMWQGLGYVPKKTAAVLAESSPTGKTFSVKVKNGNVLGCSCRFIVRARPDNEKDGEQAKLIRECFCTSGKLPAAYSQYLTKVQSRIDVSRPRAGLLSSFRIRAESSVTWRQFWKESSEALMKGAELLTRTIIRSTVITMNRMKITVVEFMSEPRSDRLLKGTVAAKNSAFEMVRSAYKRVFEKVRETLYDKLKKHYEI